MKHEGPSAQAGKATETRSPKGAAKPAVSGKPSQADAAAGHRYAGGAAMRATSGAAAPTSQPTAAPASELHRQAAELQVKHGEQLAEGAGRLGVPESALAAIVLAEQHYLPRAVPALGDKMPIRFEPYVFFTTTGRWLTATHRDQAAEYSTFDQARGQNADAAHLALRMGVGQVRGAEAEVAGYSTPQAMHDALQTGGSAQIAALLGVVAGQDDLRGALGAGDWSQAALLRAGPGFAALGFEQALETAAAVYRQVKPGGGDGDGDDKPKRRKRS